MAIKLHGAGRAKATSLIKSGKVDRDSAWSFSGTDGDALLGDPPNWSAYAKWFLGVDSDEDRETKGAWKYPYGKDGKVYRRAVIAIKSRAAQQGATDIAEAASALLEAIDESEERSRGKLLRVDEWRALLDERGSVPKDVGIVKVTTVDITKGPIDPTTGMYDIDSIISTASVDRDRDIIYQDGWQLDHYLRNPVVLWAHDHTQPPIARSLDIGLTDRGALASRDRFTSQEVYPFGAMIYRMVAGGFIRAKSVGFSPLDWTFNEERRGYDLLKAELWEHSWVPVPSNPEALIQASASGIDLAPMKEWAAKVLDNDPDESQVLCWLPRHVVENAWKQAGYVGGFKTWTSTGATCDHDHDDTGADADAGEHVQVPQHGAREAPASEHQPEVTEMDEKLIEALTSLTEALKANTEQSSKLVSMMIEKKESDDSVELSDLVGSIVGEIEAKRSGRLPEGKG